MSGDRTDACIHVTDCIVGVAIDARQDGELGVILECREDLGEHAPQCKGERTVLDPAALIPNRGREGRSKKKSKTAIPGMRRKVQVGVFEVPDIISEGAICSETGCFP